MEDINIQISCSVIKHLFFWSKLLVTEGICGLSASYRHVFDEGKKESTLLLQRRLISTAF